MARTNTDTSNPLDRIAARLGCDATIGDVAAAILRLEARNPGSWLPWDAENAAAWFDGLADAEAVESIRAAVETAAMAG